LCADGDADGGPKIITENSTTGKLTFFDLYRNKINSYNAWRLYSQSL
jgi:hypothetical protein